MFCAGTNSTVCAKPPSDAFFLSPKVDIQGVKRRQKLAKGRALGHDCERVHILREASTAAAKLQPERLQVFGVKRVDRVDLDRHAVLDIDTNG